MVAAVRRTREPLFAVLDDSSNCVGVAGAGSIISARERPQGALPLVGVLPPVFPEWLGDRTFAETHGVRFPYVAGAMANGIASVELVVAMARNGLKAARAIARGQ